MARNIKEPLNYAFCFKETLCLQRRWEDLGYILQIWLNFTIVFHLIWPIKLFRSSRPVVCMTFCDPSLGYEGGWAVILIHFTICQISLNRHERYNGGRKCWHKNIISLYIVIYPRKKFKPHNVLENREYTLYLGFYELDCSKKTCLYYSFWSLPTHWRILGVWGLQP